MASRVTHEFWEALDSRQQDELRKAADSARVNIEKLLPSSMEVERPVAAAAAS